MRSLGHDHRHPRPHPGRIRHPRNRRGARRRSREAAAILGVSWRDALDIPDGRVENTYENRLKIAAVLRRLRPRVVILPYGQGRHPDHYNTATLGYEACFLSGLAKLDTGDASPQALQNRLCQPLRRRPPQLRCRHHAFHRGASPRPDGLSLAICQPASREAASLFPRKRFASAPSPSRATTACSPASATPSPSFKRDRLGRRPHPDPRSVHVEAGLVTRDDPAF